MAQVVQLTENPIDLVDNSVLTQDQAYRIQAARRNTAEVILWDSADPPGGPSGYSLGPGQDLVIRINGSEFYTWAFTEDPAKRFAEIVIFEAANE